MGNIILQKFRLPNKIECYYGCTRFPQVSLVTSIKAGDERFFSPVSNDLPTTSSMVVYSSSLANAVFSPDGALAPCLSLLGVRFTTLVTKPYAADFTKV